MSDWRLNAPAVGVVNIDVSSSDHTLTTPSRHIYVGGTGNLDIIMADGSTALIESVAAGQMFHDIAVLTFKETTTTATNIVAFI